MRLLFNKIFISLCLLILWFGLTMWYILTIDKSFLVYSIPHDMSAVKNFTQKPLLKGEKVQGEIVSAENGLGIISIRFKSSKRIPYKDEDLLLFRFKEKGSQNWYYQNTYRSGMIYDIPFLPFGFPIIQNSKGKIYQFELESLKGNTKNSVVLDNRSPRVVSKYKQNKAQILAKPSALTEFLLKKFVNSMQIVDVYYSSIVFLLPFIFYVLWGVGYIKLSNKKKKSFSGSLNKLLSRINNILSQYPFILISIPLILICIDVFLLQVLNDLLYIVMAPLWIVICKKYKLDCNYTALFSILLLLVSLPLVRGGSIFAAEKAASWSFTFLVTLFIQMILDRKHAGKKRNT